MSESTGSKTRRLSSRRDYSIPDNETDHDYVLDASIISPPSLVAANLDRTYPLSVLATAFG